MQEITLNNNNNNNKLIVIKWKLQEYYLSHDLNNAKIMQKKRSTWLCD